MITIQQENQLIDRILAGEDRCYAELVTQYRSFAFTIALKIVENRSDAEEVAMDAFVKAFQYLKNFNRQARFSTWLYRIVFNTAVSRKRKNRVQFQDIESKNGAFAYEPANELEQVDKEVFLGKAIKKLNEADQLALQLFYIREFSLEEVAEMMGQSANTVKVRIHRARLRLADELKSILRNEALTL